jgi:hypothetical protein
MYEQDVNRDAIDQAASQHAAQVETPPAPQAETTLAYGAEGECLTKLVDLLALLGYQSNDVLSGKSTMLDATVLADVAAAEAALDFHEAAGDELLAPAEIAVGVKGHLITSTTWDALYAAAAIKVQHGEAQTAGAGESAAAGAHVDQAALDAAAADPAT